MIFCDQLFVLRFYEVRLLSQALACEGPVFFCHVALLREFCFDKLSANDVEAQGEEKTIHSPG